MKSNATIATRLYHLLTAGIAGLSLVSSAHVAAAQPAWQPERTAEIVVTAGAGGNQDQTARMIRKIWSDNGIVPNAVVVNKPGGSGAIAGTYVSQHGGDPHYLMMVAPTMFTGRIMGKTKFHYTDFTPIAVLFSEYIFVTVRADSPIKDGRDLIARLKRDPGSLSVAVASAIGNHIHMGVALPMKKAGVEVRKMKVVAFKSSGQSFTAMLGGHVDVTASTFGTVLPHLEAGKVRVLGMSAPQRLPGLLAAIPTWKEQGADVEFNSWRGMLGTKGMTPAQAAYWEAALAAAVKTEAWRQDIERNFREARFLSGAEAARYWDGQYRALESVMTEIGLARGSK